VGSLTLKVLLDSVVVASRDAVAALLDHLLDPDKTDTLSRSSRATTHIVRTMMDGGGIQPRGLILQVFLD